MGPTSHIAMLCMVTFAVLVADGTSSTKARPRRVEAEAEFRTAGTPRLAVIALAQQHISVYGDTGKIMEAPVSTGARGYETPAGIYSILEKEEEHHSNLYNDASMPFMERLTWIGIAMHAGALPGYPASHGCTRLSYRFAQQLYQVTKPGMRVVIVREDITPAAIEQPEMFNQTPEALRFQMDMLGLPNKTELGARLQTIKEAKLAEAEVAKKRALEARSAAAKKTAEAASASRFVEVAKATLARMVAELSAGERTQASSNRTQKAEAARGLAALRIAAARLQLETAKTYAQARMSAAAEAEELAKAAAAASSEAAEAAEIAREDTWPISIFISRKTQRLYIRRGREPVFEGPVTIRDPDKPIGTFVFTALSHTETPGQMHWNVVSMYKNATAIEPYSGTKRESKKHQPPKPADLMGARNALARLAIPQAAVDRISRLLLPGASLIISDEGLSSETGKDTDFIVFMSGEPQGGSTLRGALVTERNESNESKRLHWQKRRTGFHARMYSPGELWRGQGYSPFSSFFGF